MRSLPDRLLQLRAANGWSQEQLAEALGVDKSTVSRWESGACRPRAVRLLHISALEDRQAGSA